MWSSMYSLPWNVPNRLVLHWRGNTKLHWRWSRQFFQDAYGMVSSYYFHILINNLYSTYRLDELPYAAIYQKYILTHSCKRTLSSTGNANAHAWGRKMSLLSCLPRCKPHFGSFLIMFGNFGLVFHTVTSWNHLKDKYSQTESMITWS